MKTRASNSLIIEKKKKKKKNENELIELGFYQEKWSSVFEMSVDPVHGNKPLAKTTSMQCIKYCF